MAELPTPASKVVACSTRYNDRTGTWRTRISLQINESGTTRYVRYHHEDASWALAAAWLATFG